MRISNPKGTIEIWCTEYINDPETRKPSDRYKRVVQIEPLPNGDNYFVEVVTP